MNEILLSNIFVIFQFICLSCAVFVLYESKDSFCEHNGKDYPCTTPFTNIIQRSTIAASSTCGQIMSDNICPHWKYYSTPFLKDCFVCDSKTKSSLYSINSLTDPFVEFNHTCWFSGPLYSRPNLNSVNLTIAFNKTFEVYYIALQFCTELPDSVAIYKSSDYGINWSPWQFYSKDCLKSFNLQPIQQFLHSENVEHSFLPVCIDLNNINKDNSFGPAESVLPFSTTLGKKFDDSLVKWISITDIKIVLGRFEDNNYNKYHFENQKYHNTFSVDEKSMSKMYYGISDLSVGGRCQCHGHSNKCLLNEEKQIFCDCKHNTEGADCETCKEGHFDLPWSRASRSNANSCKKCHCNLHSHQCHFDPNVFRMTGHTSGGICQRCMHNTAGRQCHYCNDGYFRDWTKPLSHEGSCMKCRCHWIGSINVNMCDKKSGQCLCKDGVSGKRCDKCKVGYIQTQSVLKPCVKIDDHIQNSEAKNELNSKYHYMSNTESECVPCDEKRKRIRFKKFCRRDTVFMGTVQSREVHGKMIRFEILIKEVWRVNEKFAQFIFPNSQEQYSIPLWISYEEVRCECPSVQLGRSYLILMKYKVYVHRQREELMVNSQTVMLQWRASWQRRLLKFKAKSQSDKCAKFEQAKAKIAKRI